MPKQPPIDDDLPFDDDAPFPQLPQIGDGPDYGDVLEAWALGLNDDLATRESNALAAEDDLEKVERKNDHKRMESLRGIVHQLAKFFLVLAAILLAVGLLFWAWHLLLPCNLGFLSEDQLSRIQGILTTVLFSGLVGGYARRVMDNKSSNGSK